MNTEDIPISSDPTLGPEERETNITLAQDRDRADVYSSEKTIVKKLLANPEFAFESAFLSEDDEVVGVWGTLPAGALTIKANSRMKNNHSDVHSRSGISGKLLRERVEHVLDAPDDDRRGRRVHIGEEVAGNASQTDE